MWELKGLIFKSILLFRFAYGQCEFNFSSSWRSLHLLLLLPLTPTCPTRLALPASAAHSATQTCGSLPGMACIYRWCVCAPALPLSTCSSKPVRVSRGVMSEVRPSGTAVQLSRLSLLLLSWPRPAAVCCCALRSWPRTYPAHTLLGTIWHRFSHNITTNTFSVCVHAQKPCLHSLLHIHIHVTQHRRLLFNCFFRGEMKM